MGLIQIRGLCEHHPGSSTMSESQIRSRLAHGFRIGLETCSLSILVAFIIYESFSRKKNKSTVMSDSWTGVGVEVLLSVHAEEKINRKLRL